ncbi:hypothetical protein CAAN4_G01332 [[Candida] anglica]|uniref:Zn(2)-C6 fungal-type domain-containing protein n=1 Tax=[Candida] anglica TaxID=148631 RepID=A0ABP0EGL3_9ASCO
MSTFIRGPERKCRRSHKNSRDGCPNCKAKRIKCTEELPSCFNCIKKNYQCGYLNFPKEKLEFIRKKNDRKSREIQYEDDPMDGAGEWTQTEVLRPFERVGETFKDGQTFEVDQRHFEEQSNQFGNYTHENKNSQHGSQTHAEVHSDLQGQFGHGHSQGQGIGPSNEQHHGQHHAQHDGQHDGQAHGQLHGQSHGQHHVQHDGQTHGQSHVQSHGQTGETQTQAALSQASLSQASQASQASLTQAQASLSHDDYYQFSFTPQSNFIFDAPIDDTNISPSSNGSTSHTSTSISTVSGYNQPKQQNLHTHTPSSQTPGSSFQQHPQISSSSHSNIPYTKFNHPHHHHPSPPPARSVTPNPFQTPPANLKPTTIKTVLSSLAAQPKSQSPRTAARQFTRRALERDNRLPGTSHSQGNQSTVPPLTASGGQDSWNQASNAPGNYHHHHHPLPSSMMKALPHAVHSPTSFKRIKKLDRLQNTYLQRYLKHYRSDIRQLNNLEFRNVAPVWNHKIAEGFWTSVYNQSVVLDLYFSFFMDRSLNLLLHKCISTLDDEGFKQEEDLFIKYQDTELYKQYFFHPNDVKSLTHMSYTYYGHLIKDLRESLTLIHAEYPAKISLFAAWSTFLHSHSSVDTFCLLLSGTTTLFCKVFESAMTLNQIPPTVNTAYYVFINHSNCALIPDYDFTVIEELCKDLISFKNYSRNLSVEKYDSDRIKRDVKLARHSYDLEHFLHALIEEYYPRIVEVNRKMRQQQQQHQTESAESASQSNIYYVQVRVFYQLISHWYRIYPSEAIPMGSKFNTIRKTFYLFFSAIGKALSHVLTPIRSLMLVDPCNTFCPRTDFDPQIYEVEPEYDKDEPLLGDDFLFYQQLSRKLLRIASFFNNRVIMYSYYLSTTTVLDHEYIQHHVPQSKTDLPDVCQLLPRKLPVQETFIRNFSADLVIGPEHYPVLPGFQEEIERITRDRTRIKTELGVSPSNNDSFCYKTGFYERDYNPESWTALIIMRQQQAWEDERTTLQQSQMRMHNFDLGRQQVSNSIKYESV